jgi:hypothetical protein
MRQEVELAQPRYRLIVFCFVKELNKLMRLKIFWFGFKYGFGFNKFTTLIIKGMVSLKKVMMGVE